MTDMWNKAINFTATVLRNAKDWQEGQTALYDSDTFRPWLLQEAGGDDEEVISVIQDIIREAEDRLGPLLPY